MKHTLTILFTLFFFASFSQREDSTKYSKFVNYGQRMPRGWFDSSLLIPNTDTTIKPARAGALLFRKADKFLYVWTGIAWTKAGIAGGTTDTSSLSVRINQKLNTSDTSLLQSKLISGTTVKTVNGTSLLGSGNLTLSAIDSVTQAGAGAVKRPLSSKILETISVEDYVQPGDASKLPAFTRAIAYLKTMPNGGGIVNVKTGAQYTISGPIVLSRNIEIHFNKSKITSTDNTKPVISFTGDTVAGQTAYGYNMGVYDVELNYSTQKTTDSGTVGAIQLGKTNQNNWSTTIRNVNITNSDIGILLPDTALAISLFLTVDNVTVNRSQSWAIYFKGDPDAAGSNVTVRNFWALSDFFHNSSGMHFRAVSGLNISEVHFEFMHGQCLVAEACSGNIGNLNEENILAATYGGNPVFINSFYNSTLHIGSINTGNSQIVPQNGNIYLVNIDEPFYSQNVVIENIQDKNVSVSDTVSVSGYKYYVARAVGQGAHGRINYYGNGESTYEPLVEGNVTIGDGNTFVDNWGLGVSGWKTLTFGENTLLPKGKADSLYVSTVTQTNDSTFSFNQGGTSTPIIIRVTGSGSTYVNNINRAPSISGSVLTFPSGYTPNRIQVFHNGVLLLKNTHYTETNPAAGTVTLLFTPDFPARIFATY